MSNCNEVEAVVNSKTETLSENAAKVVVEPGKEIMPGKDVKSAAKRVPKKKASGQASKETDKPPAPKLPASQKEAGGGSDGGEKEGSVGAQGAAGQEESKPSSTKEDRTRPSDEDEGIHDDEPAESKFPVVPLSVDIENVYTAFVQQAELFDEDRGKLKKERGFSDATIDALRFRSCGEANREVIVRLRSEFGDRLMEQAGILVSEDGQLKPSFQLLEPNILIPYLGEKGRVTFLRPHKFGLTGMGIRIYLPSQALKGTVVVTESEFKAAAAAQYGYPAIGLPGIHSFAATNFPKLVELIKSFPGIETLVVLFDSEVKNDPSLPNFKKDPITRWDTQWRSYQFAYRLYRELKNVRTFVGELPATWRVNGKIDIDGALAQGRTASEFKAVVEGAMLPDDYLKKLPPEARRVLGPKIQKRVVDPPFVVRNGGYVLDEVKLDKKGNEVFKYEILSDFTFEFVRTLVRDKKQSWAVSFKNQYGDKRADEYTSDFTALREFKKWVRGLGGYIWFSDEYQLDRLIQWQKNIMPPGEVRVLQGIGYLPEEGFTLYKNCLFMSDGTRYDADEKTGVIHPMIGGSDLDGYLAESAMEGDNALASIPALGPTCPDWTDNEFLEKLRQAVDAAYKSSLHVRLALGWLIGCLYSHEIFQKYSFFPLLGVFGKRESGKTTLCEVLTQLAGLNLKPFGIEKSTPVGVERLLAWYHSLPVVLDEFRNIRQIIEAWEGYLRGLFNRQPRVKGKKEEGKTSSYPVNAGVILAGEDAPMDNALFSRMVIVNMRAVMHDAEKLAELLALPLSRLAEIVARRKQKLLPGILDDIGNFKKRLMSQGASSRVAESYAVPAACYLKFFLDRDVAAAKLFIQDVVKDAKEHNAEKEETHPVNQFWDELPRLKNQGKLDDAIEVFIEDGTKFAGEGGKKFLALAMADVHAEYANALKGRETVQTKRTIIARIAESPYFFKKNHDMEIGNARKQRNCLIVRVDHDETPHAIKELASKVSPTQGWTKEADSKETQVPEPKAVQKQIDLGTPI